MLALTVVSYRIGRISQFGENFEEPGRLAVEQPHGRQELHGALSFGRANDRTDRELPFQERAWFRRGPRLQMAAN